MGVRIEQINVESAGPISGLQLSLRDFNLIYGRNEQGKTFLVEFVIRCLFNNLSGWKLRQTDNRGKIVVSGLAKKNLSLMPTSKRKLDDFLTEAEPGMPAQISRLLVVKGAELGFNDQTPPGIGQSVLKEFLSGQGVLDGIQGQISKTVQEARTEGGQVAGHKRGELKRRSNLLGDIEECDRLFEQLEAVYSGGERQQLQARVTELEESLAEQEKAKRYHAYSINQQLQQIRHKKDLLPGEKLNALWDDYRRLSDMQKDIGRQEQKLRDLSQESANYTWLEEAISLYDQRGEQGNNRANPLFLILAIVSLVLATLIALIYPIATIIPIIVAVVFGWLYINQYREALAHAVDIEEIDKLRVEYESRFGKPLSGLPQMKEMKKSMEKAYHGSKALHDELEQEQERLILLQDRIAEQLQGFLDRPTDPERWEGEIRDLHNRRDQLQDQHNEYQLQLASLGLDQEEYYSDPVDVDFSEDSLQSLSDELLHVRGELREKTDNLNNLKQRISTKTGDEITTNWAVLIENLQRKKRGDCCRVS